jgi:ubiquinone/menaquinone biosynthesis C-methylase UbiE
LEAIAARERVSDRYWSHQDPINEQRLGWRAQTVRHLFHLLPGETILELGCGSGRLTRALVHATRDECPITAATFGLSSGQDRFAHLARRSRWSGSTTFLASWPAVSSTT